MGKDLKDKFYSLDIGGDGFISFEDWTAHYDNILEADTAHAHASFNAMDTNQATTIISKDEFVKYHLDYYISTENTLNSAVLMDRGN